MGSGQFSAYPRKAYGLSSTLSSRPLRVRTVVLAQHTPAARPDGRPRSVRPRRGVLDEADGTVAGESLPHSPVRCSVRSGDRGRVQVLAPSRALTFRLGCAAQVCLHFRVGPDDTHTAAQCLVEWQRD
jgi:hypothetical protein